MGGELGACLKRRDAQAMGGRGQAGPSGTMRGVRGNHGRQWVGRQAGRQAGSRVGSRAAPTGSWGRRIGTSPGNASCLRRVPCLRLPLHVSLPLPVPAPATPSPAGCVTTPTTRTPCPCPFPCRTTACRLRDHTNNAHTSRLEWVIIWLIVIEVVVGLFECASILGWVGGHN